MSKVFGIFESTAFAKALAADNGVRVEQVRPDWRKANTITEPHVKDRRTIVLSEPTIYGHDKYMAALHSELSKVLKPVQFFYDVEYKDNTLQQVVRDILHAQRSEHEMHGTYTGRDRILRDRYAQRMGDNGGVQHVCSQLGAMNPTVGALMYLDNEVRNEWQGYNHAECPPELKGEVDRLRSIVDKDAWLSLDSKQSLETLIRRIVHGEDNESGESGGEPDGSGDQDSDSGEQQGEEGTGSQSQSGGESPGDSGESGEEQGEDASGSGGTDQGSPGDNEGSGQSTDGHGSGSPGESGTQEQQGDPGGQGSQASAPASDDGGEEDKQQQSFQGAENHSGAGTSTALKNMGIIQDATKMKAHQFEEGVPYKPATSFRNTDLTRPDHWNHGMYSRIESTLGSFNLSKRIRKYLISLSQVGYDYGLKKGRLCNKNIGRIYAGHQQPRIYKEKQAARIRSDTAIFILGDCSGSMSGSKYAMSAACQTACSETLQSLRIAHMIAEFSSSGRTVQNQVMKHFDETFVSRENLLKRFSHDELRMGCNADGESVAWAATHLAQRSEEQKILIVLSDGYPAFHPGDRQFLKDVITDIDENSRMHLLGIGINSDAVRKYYPEYRIVQRIEDLEEVLMSLLRAKILG